MSTETEFSSETDALWGDLPKNTTTEVAEALCLACADDSLHGDEIQQSKQNQAVLLTAYRSIIIRCQGDRRLRAAPVPTPGRLDVEPTGSYV